VESLGTTEDQVLCLARDSKLSMDGLIVGKEGVVKLQVFSTLQEITKINQPYPRELSI
jgi:hypothetical protein